jgi:hypothetical protein
MRQTILPCLKSIIATSPANNPVLSPAHAGTAAIICAREERRQRKCSVHSFRINRSRAETFKNLVALTAQRHILCMMTSANVREKCRLTAKFFLDVDRLYSLQPRPFQFIFEMRQVTSFCAGKMIGVDL